jgi:hypothetical protein
MADDRVDVVFGAEFSELVSAVQQVRNLLAGLATSVKQTSDSFAGIQDDGASAFDSLLTPINFVGASLNTMLNGVLLGTQTWQQSMAKIFSNLAVSFIENVAQMLYQWLVFQAATAASGALSGGFFGSGGGGVLGALGGLFGGGAAAGGDAGAGMDLGDLAMFQAGTWSVPRDMIALVHAGEMILPADVAAVARGNTGAAPFPGGGGAAPGAGVTLNVSVQAMDAQGVAQWANANAKTLATTITRYMGNNPSARGD